MRTTRIASLLCALTVALHAHEARAQSTVPQHINLVALKGGVVDPVGEFTIVVRDLANNPVVGANVDIDFGQCTPDIRIGSSQPYPGLTTSCDGPVGHVRAITDALGIARFRIVGAASNPTGHAPGASTACARVTADGILLGTMSVGAFDQDGSSGVNPTDASICFSDSLDFFMNGSYVGRSDYNNSGTINPVDISILLGVSLRRESLASAAAYCN